MTLHRRKRFHATSSQFPCVRNFVFSRSSAKWTKSEKRKIVRSALLSARRSRKRKRANGDRCALMTSHSNIMFFHPNFFLIFVNGVAGARAHARGATSRSQSQSNSAAATTITHHNYIRSKIFAVDARTCCVRHVSASATNLGRHCYHVVAAVTYATPHHT